MNENCDNCRFQRFNRCRRFPPVHITHMENGRLIGDTAFPDVASYEWCGEWSAKQDEAAQAELRG